MSTFRRNSNRDIASRSPYRHNNSRMGARNKRVLHKQNFPSMMFRNIPKVFGVLVLAAITLGIVQMTANPQTQTCTVNAKWASKDGYTMVTSCGFMTPHPFSQAAFFDMEQGKSYHVETTGFIVPVVHKFEATGN